MMTLVLGGNGKTGRRVVQRLTARHLPVRIGSRGGGLPFDWTRPDTWRPALTDVEAVYVSYQPDLAVPGAPEAVGEFAATAAGVGVRRLVLLSGRGEPEAEAAEEALKAAGIECVVLRSAFFAQNFSEGEFLGPLLEGELALPAGEVAEPFVDAEDIADVAVAALTDDRHVGRTYDLTGPRLLTFAEAVAEIAKATERDLRYVRSQAFREADLPQEVIALLDYLFTEVMDGRNAHLSDGVRRALGREPRDFTDFVQANTHIWSVR